LKSPHATKRDENASSSVRLTCVRIAHLTSYFCFIQSPMWYEKYQASKNFVQTNFIIASDDLMRHTHTLVPT